MTDHIVEKGDKVYVFGETSMFEYRWDVVNGNELLDLFKVWQSHNIAESTKDALRKTMKDKNEPK